MELITIKKEFVSEPDSNSVECDKIPKKIKRKRKDISLATKLKIIEAVDRGGRKKKDIAKDFKIPSTTLSSLLKYREKILETKNSGTPLSIRKRVRGAKHSELDKELTVWFCQRRDKNLSINGPLLREKAEEIANRLGLVGFKCSNGWLQRMKARNQEIYGTKRTYKRIDQPEFEYIDAEDEEDESFLDLKSVSQNDVGITEEQEEVTSVRKILISFEDYSEDRKYPTTSHQEYILEDVLPVESPSEITYKPDRPHRNLPVKSDALNALDIIKEVIESPDAEASSEVLKSFDVIHKFIKETYPQFVQLKINNYFTKLK